MPQERGKPYPSKIPKPTTIKIIQIDGEAKAETYGRLLYAVLLKKAEGKVVPVLSRLCY